MEIRKYYIVKVTNRYGDILYAKGYDRWTPVIDSAKFYTQLASVTRLIKKIDAESKTEILYATMTIESIHDIVEKEVLN